MSYTLHHIDGSVKELELRVFGVHIAHGRPGKVDVQRDRKEL
ncbi:MAG: hypothetical protein ACLP5V_02600 [Candidatus Bathyarchaeia archaeon]